MFCPGCGGWGGGWGGLGFISGRISLIVWILIIFVVIGFVRFLIRKSQDEEKFAPKLPMDILKERYVKGEIDKEEYEEKKKELGS